MHRKSGYLSSVVQVFFSLLIILTLFLTGCGGGSESSPVVPKAGILYVSSFFGHRSISFGNAASADGNLSPGTNLEGPNTQIGSPTGIAIDAARNYLYIPNWDSNTVVVFHGASNATGDIAPNRIISSVLDKPFCIALDSVNDRMFVLDNVSIRIYDNVSILNGAVEPSRSITGLPGQNPGGCYYDAATDIFYIAIFDVGIFIYDNASSANGTHAATVSREISGALTGYRASRGLFVDSSDRLYVSENSASQSILVFNNASSANGNIAPNRIISGAQTLLENPLGIVVNPFTDELFVANAGSDSVLVFVNASTIDGDVAPVRTIAGIDTGLRYPFGIALDTTRQ